MLEQYFDDLVQGSDALEHSRLTDLSGLDSAHLEQLRHFWPRIPTDRRRDMMSRLATLAEDDVNLNFDDIFRYSLQDEDSTVRERGIVGLWECEDRSLISDFVSLVEGDPVEEVRVSAALGLGRFSNLAILGVLLPKDREQVQEVLTALVEDDEEGTELRRRALESVAVFNTSKISFLIQDAYHSAEVKMRLSSIYAMGRTCEAKWLPTLLNELSSDDPAMRYESAKACGALGEDEATPYLVALLEDDDLQVQLASIDALGELGGRLAAKALQRCLDNDQGAIQDAALAALEQMHAEGDSFDFSTDYES